MTGRRRNGLRIVRLIEMVSCCQFGVDLVTSFDKSIIFYKGYYFISFSSWELQARFFKFSFLPR